MPELPDVEGFRRYFARYASGERIDSVVVADPDLVRNTSPQGLGRSLSGRRFGPPERHGKWLIAPAGDGVEVLIHFGMSGRLAWSSSGGDDADDHDRVCFELSSGVLRYRDMRKFGGVWLVRSREDREDVTGPLGPDALDVGRGELGELLAGRRGGIKSALMDQRLIAGLGNLLCDEILWRARINPKRGVPDISESDRDRLHGCVGKVVKDSNRHARVPAKRGWLTGVRDEDEPDCPRCGTSLKRATVAGRTTVWCPRCQRS